MGLGYPWEVGEGWMSDLENSPNQFVLVGKTSTHPRALMCDSLPLGREHRVCNFVHVKSSHSAGIDFRK